MDRKLIEEFFFPSNAVIFRALASMKQALTLLQKVLKVFEIYASPREISF